MSDIPSAAGPEWTPERTRKFREDLAEATRNPAPPRILPGSPNAALSFSYILQARPPGGEWGDELTGNWADPEERRRDFAHYCRSFRPHDLELRIVRRTEEVLEG